MLNWDNVSLGISAFFRWFWQWRRFTLPVTAILIAYWQRLWVEMLLWSIVQTIIDRFLPPILVIVIIIASFSYVLFGRPSPWNKPKKK